MMVEAILKSLSLVHFGFLTDRKPQFMSSPTFVGGGRVPFWSQALDQAWNDTREAECSA